MNHLCWTISFLDECNFGILCLFLCCGCNNQMAKSIKELKKENQFLKSKSEKSDVTLIELVDEVRSLCLWFVLDHLTFMHFIRKKYRERSSLVMHNTIVLGTIIYTHVLGAIFFKPACIVNFVFALSNNIVSLLVKYVTFSFSLSEQRERLKKQLERTKNQKEKLESLCRSLQAERKQSSSENKSNNSVATWRVGSKHF